MSTGGQPPIASLRKAAEEEAKVEEAAKENSSAASSGRSAGPAEGTNNSHSDDLQQLSREEFEQNIANKKSKS
ncbi:hypothetical protein PGT21_010392 [Puccinia graminis f. sp. tritici]|uniref:Uncharacterized protein n=1 Tax=Puccinia graminis f. sp. tritici TaxID=56615 RepID=A0A5B0MNB5_PUCGR|nr:hypothetical protein PGT21_010392 [Puccinia graminis f. sp. tritici]